MDKSSIFNYLLLETNEYNHRHENLGIPCLMTLIFCIPLSFPQASVGSVFGSSLTVSASFAVCN